MSLRVRTLIVFFAILAALGAIAGIFVLDFRLGIQIAFVIVAGVIAYAYARIIWWMAEGIVKKRWPPRSKDGPDAC